MRMDEHVPVAVGHVGVVVGWIAENDVEVRIGESSVEFFHGRPEAVAEIKAEADKYATEKRADADLFSSQLQAKGEVLVRKAEAEGEKMRNQAMTGDGGRVLVALKAAQNLNLNEITVSTIETNPLDVKTMTESLGRPAE